jgi:hypothetical protein
MFFNIRTACLPSCGAGVPQDCYSESNVCLSDCAQPLRCGVFEVVSPGGSDLEDDVWLCHDPVPARKLALCCLPWSRPLWSCEAHDVAGTQGFDWFFW